MASLAVGESHSLALRTDGTLLAWGYNHYGPLGDGTAGIVSRPLLEP
jgi:alpha-tubulin suppressor-like RCC1 family protein